MATAASGRGWQARRRSEPETSDALVDGVLDPNKFFEPDRPR